MRVWDMKMVLLHLDDHESMPAMLQAALLVAQRFGSHIEGAHVRQGIPRMVPMGPEGAGLATTDLIESVERVEKAASQRLRAQFEEFAREHGIPVLSAVPMSREPSASWRELVAAGDDALASRGRAFDLTIVGKPVPSPSGPRMSALEAVLFESGRPVLVVPPERPETMGERVVIAWNGSTETARTIALGMPFLLGAAEVTVLVVEEGLVPGPSGREIAQSLMRHGIPARCQQVRTGGRAVGAALLEESAKLGADLLLKGAYTQSRLRQMIFGGATSHILAHSTLPVLMAH